MRKKILLISVTFLVVAARSWADDAFMDNFDTMCLEDEDVYISCTFKSGVGRAETVASVCAKENRSPETGYVQYRYGAPGGRLEMSFPQSRMAPKGLFRIYTSESGSGVGRALRFSRGEYLYSFEWRGFEGYRLVVRRRGEEVFNKLCDEPGKPYLIDKAFRGIELVNYNARNIPVYEK